MSTLPLKCYRGKGLYKRSKEEIEYKQKKKEEIEYKKNKAK